jgi:ribosomal-protein-alanine N-acetyltransferase
MTVREATAADLDALCAIESACFPDDPWSRGMLAEELVRPGGIVLVAEATAASAYRTTGSPSSPGLSGFAIGWAVLDELHVLQVAVRPEVRRAGLGRALVMALHARAPHAEVAWLEVRHDNLAAITLYERLEYAAIARRPRYYSDGSDCVVMRATLGRAQ